MKIYWSSSSRSYFDSRVNTVLPEDAIEISVEHRDELMAGAQRNCIVIAGPDGRPALQELPSRAVENATALERTWRDSQLLETDGPVARHRDELEAGDKTTLSATQYDTLQTYRRDLRAWPTSPKFPVTVQRPSLVLPVAVAAAPVRKARARKVVAPVEPSLS